MCLQWCQVQGWVLDNDLPCAGCDRAAPAQLPPAFACTTCRHRREGVVGAFCALTRADLPVAGRCCHWDAPGVALTDQPLVAAPIAPWLAPATLAAALAAGATTIGDLAVPLVFGVPAGDWNAALGLAPAPPAVAPAGVDAAIEAALATVAAGGPALRAALVALASALMPDSGLLPEDWSGLVTDVLDLCRALHGGDATIVALLDDLEERAGACGVCR